MERSTYDGQGADLVLLEDEALRASWQERADLSLFSREVADAAAQSRGPLGIGVFAPQGPGRSTILHQASSILSAECPQTVTVNFNAWRYGRSNSFVLPLLAAITREVEDKAIGWTKRAKETCWNLERVLRSIAWKLSSHREIQIEMDGHRPVGEKTLRVQSLYQEAFDMLAKLTARSPFRNGRFKVVVFVDDLDRCIPEGGLRLLEGVQRVLAQPGFVFVIAIDETAINDQTRGCTQGTLDQFVQRPVYVPHDQCRSGAFLDELISTHAAFREVPAIRRVLDHPELKEVLALGAQHDPGCVVPFINNLIVDGHIYSVWSEDKRSHLGETLDDFLGMAAVTRMLRERLAPHTYRSLVHDEALCGAIATVPGRHIAERVAAMGSGATRTNRDSAIHELAERPLLMDLLDSDMGRSWLTDGDHRLAVEQFLVTLRNRQAAPLSSGADAIMHAVWDSLGKGDDEPILSSELDAVDELSLAMEPLIDSDLTRLHDLKGLRQLILAGCTRITDAGIEHIVRLKQLQLLVLDGTRITDAGLRHVAWLKQLTALYTAHTAVTDTGLEHIARLKRLRILNLTKTRVTDAGLDHLTGLKKLQELRLGDTGVTDAGLERISSFTRLRALTLDNTAVTDAGLAHLAKLDQLRELALDGAHITDAGLVHLAHLSELRVLDLSNTKVTELGLRHLGALENLQELYLADTWVTDIELDGLPDLNRLEELDVEKTMVTTEGERWLHQRLPHCLIVR